MSMPAPWQDDDEKDSRLPVALDSIALLRDGHSEVTNRINKAKLAAGNGVGSQRRRGCGVTTSGWGRGLGQ